MKTTGDTCETTRNPTLSGDATHIRRFKWAMHEVWNRYAGKQIREVNHHALGRGLHRYIACVDNLPPLVVDVRLPGELFFRLDKLITDFPDQTLWTTSQALRALNLRDSMRGRLGREMRILGMSVRRVKGVGKVYCKNVDGDFDDLSPKEIKRLLDASKRRARR